MTIILATVILSKLRICSLYLERGPPERSSVFLETLKLEVLVELLDWECRYGLQGAWGIRVQGVGFMV